MRKTMLLLASVAAITGSALTVPAVARDRSERGDLTANQMVNQADAQTAHMKVDLRLTPEQEKNWSGFESAMRDMGKQRADREIAMRDERAKQQGPVDVLEQISKSADSRIERANNWKKLADAAKPLYASLDEQQKRRFAESLFGGDRGRDTY
jgi:LTXXQ motif family protein